MNRSGQNFIVDAGMFLLMMGLAGIGFLLEYVLVPGRQVPLEYGFNAELFWLGLERDQWANIHLVMAYVLLALLVLHIVLHWKAIGAMYRNLFFRPVWRKILTPAFVVVSIALCLFFLVSQPEFREFKRGAGRGRPTGASPVKDSLNDPVAKDFEATYVESVKEYELPEVQKQAEDVDDRKAIDKTPVSKGEKKQLEMVKGMYTLGEVAVTYYVPTGYIIEKLGLPRTISSVEKLGRLRRMYGFTMSDIERIIAEYKNVK